MKKMIYYTNSKTPDQEKTYNGQSITIYKINSLREMVIHVIHNFNVSGIICDISNKEDDIIESMEVIWSISPYVYFILFQTGNYKSDFLKINKDKIIYIQSLEDIESLQQFTPAYLRKFHRIDWPLKVNCAYDSEFKNAIPGKILSLSAGGALVEVNPQFTAHKGNNIYLMIEFKEFKLYVESTVVRSDLMSGMIKFAAEFHHVSKITQNCIDTIIKDKLAKRLLLDIESLL